ncbi:MAG TPA: type II toxin-antitoxin system RelE/ParE family toxin [Chitinophagaceae bacterium]|nr:type II toxin-antitoxin system RelE/ParE family toxin [Chitinophagaceae bacterium]
MYSLIIKPRAILMTKDAYNWYEEQKPDLGEEFLDELDGVYNKLSSHPEYFGKIKKNFRQVALKRFPFVIVYEIIKTEVVVFAVFHTSRNPKFKFKD